MLTNIKMLLEACKKLSIEYEILHPNQSEQVARLEKAIGELAAVAMRQKEIAEKHVADPGAAQADLIKRLEQTIEQLAAVASRPLVVDVKAPQVTVIETVAPVAAVAEKVTPVEAPPPARQPEGQAEEKAAPVAPAIEKTVVVKEEPKVKKSSGGRKATPKQQ